MICCSLILCSKRQNSKTDLNHSSGNDLIRGNSGFAVESMRLLNYSYREIATNAGMSLLRKHSHVVLGESKWPDVFIFPFAGDCLHWFAFFITVDVAMIGPSMDGLWQIRSRGRYCSLHRRSHSKLQCKVVPPHTVSSSFGRLSADRLPYSLCQSLTRLVALSP